MIVHSQLFDLFTSRSLADQTASNTDIENEIDFAEHCEKLFGQIKQSGSIDTSYKSNMQMAKLNVYGNLISDGKYYLMSVLNTSASGGPNEEEKNNNLMELTSPEE